MFTIPVPTASTHPLLSLSSMVKEIWLHVFKADFCFEIMHLRGLLVRNVLGSLDTMSQEKFEFTGLLSFALLKIPAVHEKICLKVYSGLERLKAYFL